jgi:hypothetical protein
MPVTAEGAVPPAEAESEETAGARADGLDDAAPGFHAAEEDTVGEGTVVFLTATGGAES